MKQMVNFCLCADFFLLHLFVSICKVLLIACNGRELVHWLRIIIFFFVSYVFFVFTFYNIHSDDKTSNQSNWIFFIFACICLFSIVLIYWVLTKKTNKWITMKKRGEKNKKWNFMNFCRFLSMCCPLYTYA